MQLKSGAQHLRCYDSPNQVGYHIDISNTAIPNLASSPYYFDNRMASCTYNGIYFLYDSYNFNTGTNAAVYAETWGDNYNVNLNDFAYKASSVRLTGAPDGYKYDTLNFYQNEFYQGAEQYFYSDASRVQVDNFGQSMVVTGCNPWTLYDYDNYRGQAVCFYPSDMMACSPGFFRQRQFMGGMANRVSSVRKGCFSSIKIRGESMEEFNKHGQEQGQEGTTYNMEN